MIRGNFPRQPNEGRRSAHAAHPRNGRDGPLQPLEREPSNEHRVGAKALSFLTPEQVEQIDELLASLGEYGELRLIVQHGELRYMNRVESHRAL